MVKMETRYPVEGQFEAIDNHCVVITACSHKTWKFCKHYLHFFGKTIPCGKIFKILFQKFHHLIDQPCCVEISWHLSDGKSAKSCVIYQKWKERKFRLPPKLLPLRGSYSKCARASHQQCTHSAPDYPFTFGVVIDERVNTVFCRVGPYSVSIIRPKQSIASGEW